MANQALKFQSTPQEYTYQSSDSGFINIAHRGTQLNHVMYLSGFYIDMQTLSTTLLLSAQSTRWSKSTANSTDSEKVNKNFNTIYLSSPNFVNKDSYLRTINKSNGTITYKDKLILETFWSKDGTTTEPGFPSGVIDLDFSDKSLSSKYQFGFVLKDYNTDCAGIKFNAIYKIEFLGF